SAAGVGAGAGAEGPASAGLDDGGAIRVELAGGGSTFSPNRGTSRVQSTESAVGPASTFCCFDLKPNISTAISHTPWVRSSVYRPFSSVYVTTFAPPCRAVTVAPGMNWSAARTEPLC